MGYLIAPNGVRIVATVETIPGRCPISDVALGHTTSSGFELTYSGETEVDWDGQKTVTANGQRLFLDEDGNTWFEGHLTFHLQNTAKEMPCPLP